MIGYLSYQPPLLLVSLSQPVKRKQSQNRGNTHDNSFLTYNERQTVFSKNCGYLIDWLSTNTTSTLFFNCLYRFPGIASVRRRKKKKTWGLCVPMRPGNETIQQRNWSAGIRFAHALSGSDLASILKVWNRSFRSRQLGWFPSEVWVHNYASR